MSRDWRLYVNDIVTACSKILRYTESMTQESFNRDAKTFDAVMRNLEIIGEAGKRLPDDFLERTHMIEWRKIKGLRDIIAHEYFGIDEDIIWDVVTKKILSCFKHSNGSRRILIESVI